MKKPHILLVEDNEQNRYLATFLLERNGHIVIHAPDGPAGLDLAVREHFDLVLLDIHMPVMDGVEAIGHIRASSEDWCDVPVIALTADAMSGDRERYLGMGMDDYISKPIDARELATRYVRLLKGRKRDADAA